MEKDKIHFRAPVSETYRKKSPFDQLLEHMGKVRECINLLGDGLIRYYKGDYKGFSELTEKVSSIEHDADIIKGNLRNHIPSSLFMPVDKGKFLWALREQDAILDHAENLVQMLDMRVTKIPDELQTLFIEHAKLVMKTVSAMEDAVESIRDLVQTSFIQAVFFHAAVPSASMRLPCLFGNRSLSYLPLTRRLNPCAIRRTTSRRSASVCSTTPRAT